MGHLRGSHCGRPREFLQIDCRSTCRELPIRSSLTLAPFTWSLILYCPVQLLAELPPRDTGLLAFVVFAKAIACQGLRQCCRHNHLPLNPAAWYTSVRLALDYSKLPVTP